MKMLIKWMSASYCKKILNFANEGVDANWWVIGECVIAIFARINDFFNKRKLSHLFVPEGRWKEGLGKAIAASILTVLHPPRFRSAVKRQVECQRAEKDPNEAIRNSSGIDCFLIWVYPLFTVGQGFNAPVRKGRFYKVVFVCMCLKVSTDAF